MKQKPFLEKRKVQVIERLCAMQHRCSTRVCDVGAGVFEVCDLLVFLLLLSSSSP